MIEAELQGKVSSELQNVEDLLTSAVFGLLQYMPPKVFWPVILTRAASCKGKLFVERCKELGAHIPSYEKVDVHFWPVHQEFGEPDLLLVFSNSNQLPLCFIIEAKLGAAKSGREQQDQLNRYLAALRDSEWLSRITGFHRPMVLPGLIYLTTSAAWSELHDSIEHAPEHLVAESTLFLLQWQDILEIARKIFPHEDEPQRKMLRKIAAFLEHRDLEYFHGFTHLSLDDDTAKEVYFYNSRRKGTFQGFTMEPFEQVTAIDTVFYGGDQ